MIPRQPFGRFFLPGPTEVSAEVLDAQRRPMIGHRSAAMEVLFASLQLGLRAVFRTKRPVYSATSSATGLMEAALRNGARRRVLALVNGGFGERFYRIALACGFEADALRVAPGQVHTPELLVDALRRRDYDAVTVVHSETSTGALNPVAALAQTARNASDVMLLVDSVSGIGGVAVESDAWQLDFVFTGSQKALALPPGLSFGVAHERLLARARSARGRGIYFDLVDFEAFVGRHQPPHTPAVSLYYALDVQLERIAAETVEARWARHTAMAERCWAWVDEMRERGFPLGILAPIGYRSPTVTCLTLPAGRSAPAVVAALAARGWTIGAGYGDLAATTIRIGHMGDHTVAELEALLDALGEVVGRGKR